MQEGTELTLEEKFAVLEEITSKMESEELSLEESFRLYKEGMDLLKKCNEDIDRVEKQVLLLQDDGDTEVFE